MLAVSGKLRAGQTPDGHSRTGWRPCSYTRNECGDERAVFTRKVQLGRGPVSVQPFAQLLPLHLFRSGERICDAAPSETPACAPNSDDPI